ncbi:MAG: PAS domain S-box protein [Hydrogenophaga sp.]|nr:PAS domain S-box protein [Hydrogenophaga sp.]MDP3923276.1 PAS domain S-box protein [Hydrogenophaga sp.]
MTNNTMRPGSRLHQAVWQRLTTWQPDTQSMWKRYAVAVVLTLLAAWLRVALAPAESGGRFVTLSLAAALAALYGGFGAGMVSTLLGMVLVNFFLVEPYFSLAFSNLREALWLNLWHLLAQLVVVGSIALMQQQNHALRLATQRSELSNQQLKDTFEHSATGMAHSHLDGRWIRVNQTYCDLVGYTHGELLRMHFRDFTHPQDLGLDLDLLARTLAGELNHYSFEKRYIHKQGHTVWVHLTLSLIRTTEGAPDYLIAVVQDISTRKFTETALRTSEMLLRQAQTMAGMATWQADVARNHFTTLSGSHTLLGLPFAEFSNGDLMALTHPDDQARMLENWTSAVQGQSAYDHEYRVVLNGSVRWFSVQAEFERDAQGRAVRALGVTHDVTEHKRAQREIQQLNASLEQRIQARTQALKSAYDELEIYSYAVAHDLRSPLRIINGYAQALQEDAPTLDASSRQHLQRIMAASTKMGALIDGLLRLSKYARSAMQRQPVDLSTMATRLLEELAHEQPERQVQWSVEPHLQAQADPVLMEALLQNLLHNAWKYTGHTAQPQIRVLARERDGQHHFCVSDNGAGFDMARADKLFQPFQRLHMPHEFGGLGIGLATALRIVKRHGGELQGHSAPGEGATFCFTLPPEASPPATV